MSLNTSPKPRMADLYPGGAKAAVPNLVMSNNWRSGWCQVWPLASWGGAGSMPLGRRWRQLGWPFLLLPSAESLVRMREHCTTDNIRRNVLHTIAVNGAFNASRAMSKWLRRGVRLSAEGFVSVPLSEVCDAAHSDETVVAVHLTLGDQMHGHTLLVMPIHTACKLVDIVTQAKSGTTRQLDEMAISCLQETGNILSSSFMNSLSKWLDITAEPSTPQVKIDMLGAIFDAVIVEQAKVGDNAFMAKSVFSVDGQWLEWDFYFLPSTLSLRLIEASCDD